MRKPRLYLCCYHKTGTILLANVFGEICREFGWRFEVDLGRVERIPPEGDVLLFAHSLVDFQREAPQSYVGAHLIRDPRDVIVSGYLYHKRCREEWCVHEAFDTREPIRYPNVQFSQQHRPESWKKQ